LRSSGLFGPELTFRLLSLKPAGQFRAARKLSNSGVRGWVAAD
jgi:hypothetical protein